MSDDTEKEGVVIDVTPEPEETVPADEPARDKPGPDRAMTDRLPLIIGIVLLLLVSAAFVFVYQYTRELTGDLLSLNARLDEGLLQQKQLQERLQEAQDAIQEQARRLLAQQQKVEAQEEKLAETRKHFDQQEQLLDRERQQMQEREAELRASVADVHKRVGASGTQWMVAEAEYLLRLANERLTLARDLGTARAALLLADQRLRDTGDPGWNGVRRQIARDIARLDEARLPDLAGISARLSALVGQVPRLRLASATLGGPPHSESHPVETAPRASRSWDTLLDDLWAGFKETVRIRRNDQPVQAMLPPEQQFFLYENLRLHLEMARLALMRGDDRLYHDSLGTVADWLASHFDPHDELTRSMRKTVTELNAVNIRPPLPDISQSLQALKRREKLNADLARPIAPPAEPAQ